MAIKSQLVDKHNFKLYVSICHVGASVPDQFPQKNQLYTTERHEVNYFCSKSKQTIFSTIFGVKNMIFLLLQNKNVISSSTMAKVGKNLRKI